MPLKLPENKLVVATHNKGKRDEIEDLLKPFAIEVLTSLDLGLEDPVEDGKTFAANALIKADAASRATGLAALGDDSGLVVEALDGAPGIFSARWAYPPGKSERDFGYAMERVQKALEEKQATRQVDGRPLSRKAAFYTCMCLQIPGKEPLYFEGRVEGELVWPIRGADGFGYDPMFAPFEYEGGDGRTFGEMTFEEKQKISHRARALAKVFEALF